jgi:hypothetical protein
MTLEEIENSLPNRLHDAEMQRFTVDYEQRTLTMEVRVWVGSMEESSKERERYRRGLIEVSGLIFLVTEPPDSRYPFRQSTQLTIDGCDRRENLDVKLVKSLPDESFFRSVWVKEWNAFIHLAATDAKFTWIDQASSVEELTAKS